MTKIKQIIDFEIIQKKINNTISEKEELMFQRWLEEDESHQQYYKKTINYFEKGSAFDAVLPDEDKAWQVIESKIDTQKIVSWKKIVGFGSAIAATLVLLVISFLSINKSDFKPPNTTATVQPQITSGQARATLTLSDGSIKNLQNGELLNQEIDGVKVSSDGQSITYSENTNIEKVLKYNALVVPRGGEFFVKLSDGTNVWLNAETTLKYPVQFVGNERNVELIGEAYFEVAEDKTKPFNVISDNHKVQALGTSFNISSYAADNQVTTTLVEGKVKVNSTDMKNAGIKKEERFLLPNQQSQLDKSSGEIVRLDVDSNQFIAWTTGKFSFQEHTLNDMMKILARWYDIDVFYDNESVRSVKFTGGFKRYDNFEKVKELIEKTSEMKITLRGSKVVIIK